MGLDYMTCMETYGNGVGIGMEHIPMIQRLIMLALLEGLTACVAAVAGAIQRGTPLHPTAITTTRATGPTALVSGLLAPEFCTSSEGLRSVVPPPASAGGEHGAQSPSVSKQGNFCK